MDFIKFKECAKWDKNRLTTFNKSNHYSTAIDSTRVRKVMSKKFVIECPICHKKHELRYMELDHIVARQDGGADTNSNVCYICASCHNKKSLLELWNMTASAEYKTIQRKELKSKKENAVLYSLFEYISRASEKTLKEHPRYSLRMIVMRIFLFFGLTVYKVKKLLHSFSNIFTLRKVELENFIAELRCSSNLKVAV